MTAYFSYLSVLIFARMKTRITALSTSGLYPTIIANDYGYRNECGADLDDSNLSAYVLAILYPSPGIFLSL